MHKNSNDLPNIVHIPHPAPAQALISKSPAPVLSILANYERVLTDSAHSRLTSNMGSSRNSRRDGEGLEWKDEIFDPDGLFPKWLPGSSQQVIPHIEDVCREKLQIPASQGCEATFLKQGLYNRTYLVTVGNPPTFSRYVMKVSLPVHPGYKTHGAVATMQWIRQTTNLPVPHVVGYNYTMDEDAVYYEWILMEMMPGKPLASQWANLSMTQKTALVEQLARFQFELYQASELAGFRGIGTLRKDWLSPTLAPRELLSLEFFFAEELDLGFEIGGPCGPHENSYRWLKELLAFAHRKSRKLKPLEMDQHDWEDQEAQYGEYEKVQYARLLQHYTRRFKKRLRTFFPGSKPGAEHSFLWHDDLSRENILVDDQGTITGIVDWECVSCLPGWVSTQFPRFLEGRTQEVPPLVMGDSDEELLLQSNQYAEFELTQLRDVYTARMRQLRPEWDDFVQEGAPMADFFRAARGMYMEFAWNTANLWLIVVENGGPGASRYQELRWGDITHEDLYGPPDEDSPGSQDKNMEWEQGENPYGKEEDGLDGEQQ